MKPARGVLVSHVGGRLWRLSGTGWALRVQADHEHEIRELGDMLSAFERTRRGGLVAALAAMASVRAVRQDKPGAVSLLLVEAGGDPALRPGDWEVSADLRPPRRRRTR